MQPTKKEDEEYVEYSSVTLELKPEDAVKLVNASEKGDLHLTIHSKIIEQGDQSKATNSKE